MSLMKFITHLTPTSRSFQAQKTKWCVTSPAGRTTDPPPTISLPNTWTQISAPTSYTHTLCWTAPNSSWGRSTPISTSITVSMVIFRVKKMWFVSAILVSDILGYCRDSLYGEKHVISECYLGQWYHGLFWFLFCMNRDTFYLHMNSIKSNGDITFIHDRERKDIHIHQYLL